VDQWITYSNSWQTQIGLSRQLTLDVAAGFGVRLKLGLQGLNLFLRQPWAREVLCIFFVVHDWLMVEVDHVKRRVRVEVAIHWMHHGRVGHRWVEGNRLLHGDGGMASECVGMVEVIHVVRVGESGYIERQEE
jgi:hypothetical protein